ncbi:hypothetical protein KEM55_003519 [Ascosphaera atra]|nr:hypothetical protein KEM55_003519 [Ascosphaera atra]
MRLPLQGKTAFITGGSSGIGLGIGKRFLREGGRRVIIAGRDKLRLVQAMGELDEVIRGMRVEGTYANEPDEFSELMEDGGMGPMDLYEHGAGKGRVITPREGRPDGTYNGAGHGSASLNPLRETSEPVTPTSGPEISHFRHITLMIGDISKPAFWSSPAVSNILDRTDVLVNSAGLSQSAILPLAKEDDIEKMIDTNLRGTVLACRAFMKRVMRSTRTSTKRREIAGANEDGKSSIDDEAGQDKCILNVSSLHGVRPGIGATTYAATKAGVISLTHAIVNEAASLPRPLPLRANVLVPGYIQTKILEDISPEFLDKARRKIPAGRLGNVQEVADAAVFLVKNRYCNGTVLNIDGGLGSRAP